MRALGRRSHAVTADVAVPEDCTRLVEEALRELGSVDVLINNAVVGTAVPATRETPDEFRRVRDPAQQWTGRKGIRVNALAPGFFPSEMTEQYPDGYLEAMMIRVPAGRPGDAQQLLARRSSSRARPRRT